MEQLRKVEEMGKHTIYKNITLKEMLEDLVKWQLDEDNEYGGEFYYRNVYGDFIEITQVDLLCCSFC